MKILLSHLKEITPIWIPQKKNIKTLDNQTNRYMRTKHLILAGLVILSQILQSCLKGEDVYKEKRAYLH